MPTESDYEMLQEDGDFDGDDLYVTDDGDVGEDIEFDVEEQQELIDELAELEEEGISGSSINSILRGKPDTRTCFKHGSLNLWD
jgi:hypothetical protein